MMCSTSPECGPAAWYAAVENVVVFLCAHCMEVAIDEGTPADDITALPTRADAG
jgi:hypothetical protein